MCGRYGRRGDKQRIAEWMQTHNTDVFDELDETNLVPSFNVAPQSFQPVVRLNSETGERELAGTRQRRVFHASRKAGLVATVSDFAFIVLNDAFPSDQ
jgi:putative SOS response-associated peptidase YedK